MKEAPGARVVSPLVEAAPHSLRFRGAARIGPGDELGGRPAAAVDAHQAVPVAGHARGDDPNLLFACRRQRAVDAFGDQANEAVGVRRRFTGFCRPDLVGEVAECRFDHRATHVVDDGTHRGRAEVEREHTVAGFHPRHD